MSVPSGTASADAASLPPAVVVTPTAAVVVDPAPPSATVVEIDEGPRRDTSLERLAALPGLVGKEGSHTAGNSPGVNDGASCVIVCSEEFAHARTSTVEPLLPSLSPSESPVTLAASSPSVLAVHPSLAVESVRDLVALAKSRPRELNYSSGSTGAPTHLSAELFKSMAGVDAMHVPYKGAPEIITSVMGGEILFGFPTLATVIPLAKSGKLRVLAVTSEKRHTAMPDVPAIAETVPEFDVVSWFGLVGPARMPAEAIRRIDQEMARLASDSGFKTTMQSKGTDVIGLNSLAFAAFFKKDMQRWKRAVEASGAQVD